MNRLAALAREYQSVLIVDTYGDDCVDRQHMMVGAGVYPLDGWPEVDKESLLRILDVQADKWSDWSIQRTEKNDFIAQMVDEQMSTDREATLGRVPIGVHGEKLLAVFTQGGMVFVNWKYIRPIMDEKEVSYYSRETTNGTVIVAKRGWQVIATIGVEKQWADEDTAEELWHIAQEARTLADRRKPGFEQQRM